MKFNFILLYLLLRSISKTKKNPLKIFQKIFEGRKRNHKCQDAIEKKEITNKRRRRSYEIFIFFCSKRLSTLQFKRYQLCQCSLNALQLSARKVIIAKKEKSRVETKEVSSTFEEYFKR